MPTRPATTNSMTFANRTEDTLQDVHKIFRDCFVREYIKDFNAKAAVIRAGFDGTDRKASQRAHQLMHEPYVANKIYDTVRVLQPSDIVSRGQVMAKLWEEGNNPGNLCSTRVTAVAHIAKMLGMFQQERDDTKAPVNVMLIPVMNVGDWEQSAALAQSMLKKAVTDQA